MTDVIATLQGTDTKDRRVLVVGGHYDSRASDVLDAQSDAPGANDDASGVAVVLECLRVLSHYSFPATIKFVAFEGEEQGLIGSAHLAQSLATAKTRVIAMLNNDIVGGDRTPGRANRGRARIFSEGLPENATEHAARLLENRGELDDSVSREFARYAEQLQRVYVPRVSIELEYRRDRYMRGGDHLSFNHEGFAAVRFTDYFENFEHQHQNVRVENGIQYGDLPRFTTPSYTADIARINAITLAALASAPAAPGDVHFLPKLDRGTDLSWSPAEDAAAYRVLWRPTAQPQWEGSQVTTATRIHLPQSADNYIIAVASRSPQAYESLPVVAGVQR
jgi:Zn-dependent M28 family amino/carboxypeptidase